MREPKSAPKQSGRPRRYSAEDIKTIEDLVADGKTVNEIQTATGATNNKIYEVIRSIEIQSQSATATMPASLPSERARLKDIIDKAVTEGKPEELDFSIGTLEKHRKRFQNPVSGIVNPVPQESVGVYREPSRAKAVTSDVDQLDKCLQAGIPIPRFLEAGPRRNLVFSSNDKLRAAVVTTGGLAPGLNAVVHSIVYRHTKTYAALLTAGGGMYGFQNGIAGLINDDMIPLSREDTEQWLDVGGSKLGSGRGATKSDVAAYLMGKAPESTWGHQYHVLDRLVAIRRSQDESGSWTDSEISDAFEKVQREELDIVRSNLKNKGIDILYVIGGDGSLRFANHLAKHPENDHTIVVGIPKTMDNDVMWVWTSFGYASAVDQATQVINTLHVEAESTRRAGVIEIFGRDSGFVAANAAFASGHVDLVLIPEAFLGKQPDEMLTLLHEYRQHLVREVQRKRLQLKAPHLVIIVAEGTEGVLRENDVALPHPNGGFVPTNISFLEQVSEFIGRIEGLSGRFTNKPMHLVRSQEPNAQDRIYCQRLGALAVDNAIAGYNDFMISQWMTEYVLVPLWMVEGRKKVPTKGMFWLQVEETTGQPHAGSA